MPKPPKSKDRLLPIRHPQRELFICDIADAVLKSDMASMAHPIFALSKQPDLNIREYRHGDVKLTVTPSVRGLATIYDKDILIFAISQIMAARKEGRRTSRQLILSARSFLVFTNRNTGGGDYEQLEQALHRLTGTRLHTTIATGGETQDSWFGLLEQAEVVRQGGDGRIKYLKLVLSEWLYNAIEANEVLTMHPDYFRLRKPLERRIYEIARKHCGQQPLWVIGLELLHKKSGSASPLRQFRYLVKEIAEENVLPDYLIAYDGEKDQVRFVARSRAELLIADQQAPQLKPETYVRAERILGHWDPHETEQLWRDWLDMSDLPPPADPDASYLAFCQRWITKRKFPSKNARIFVQCFDIKSEISRLSWFKLR
jgi:plasmid replication initiation protein